MVDFTMPTLMTDEFVGKIPEQRALVNRLFEEGRLLTYALSLEASKLWAVFTAETEADLLELVSTMPLTPYMQMRVSELTFYNAAHPFIPAFSVN